MKRLAFLIAMVGVAGIALTAANARTHAATTTICHRTASKTNPYVKQAVSGKALRDALKRPADIVPAPAGGCPKTVLSPTSGGRAFAVAMTGNAESPAGDPVATGTATFRLRAGQGQVCYQMAAKNLAAGGRGPHPPWRCRDGWSGRRPAQHAERGGRLDGLRRGRTDAW